MIFSVLVFLAGAVVALQYKEVCAALAAKRYLMSSGSAERVYGSSLVSCRISQYGSCNKKERLQLRRSGLRRANCASSQPKNSTSVRLNLNTWEKLVILQVSTRHLIFSCHDKSTEGTAAILKSEILFCCNLCAEAEPMPAFRQRAVTEGHRAGQVQFRDGPDGDGVAGWRS